MQYRKSWTHPTLLMNSCVQLIKSLTSSTPRTQQKPLVPAESPQEWTASSISKSLSVLFNKSITTGMLPTKWKFARVIPIPKSGCSKDPANYRPISILAVISKLLEKHIHNLLLLHLNSVSPISQHQWGFTAGRSTAALLSFTHNCQAALGDEVCSVFFLTYANLLIRSLTCHSCKRLQNYRSILVS